MTHYKPPEIPPETRARIEEGLANWHDPNSPARKRYDEAMKYWDEVLRPYQKAIEESTRLTQRDYDLRINI